MSLLTRSILVPFLVWSLALLSGCTTHQEMQAILAQEKALEKNPLKLPAEEDKTLDLMTAEEAEADLHTATAGNLKLYVFDCGRTHVKDISIFSPGVDQGVSKDLVVTCYLIKHPKGLLVWDTGLPDKFIQHPQGVSLKNGALVAKVEKTLKSQLAEIAVDPYDVDFVAFSHLHMDHSGNAGLFPNAKVLIQEQEYQAAFSKNPETYSFNPETYASIAQKRFVKLHGDLDVFGDGRVVIKHAPGHTPGHQMLYVNLAKTGPVVLSGDLYHFAKNREYKRVPSFNFNKKTTLATMGQMEKFIAEKEAKLWIQHDADQRSLTKLSPLYYE